jgi:hypothetical protein
MQLPSSASKCVGSELEPVTKDDLSVSKSVLVLGLLYTSS